LMSDYTPWSFDARYFGPIARSAVRAHVKPVWTW
jgi:type IV secretory pathway protease TraF